MTAGAEVRTDSIPRTEIAKEITGRDPALGVETGLPLGVETTPGEMIDIGHLSTTVTARKTTIDQEAEAPPLEERTTRAGQRTETVKGMTVPREEIQDQVHRTGKDPSPPTAGSSSSGVPA